MKIFIEADSIIQPKMSGIGHATLELLRALDADVATTGTARVTAIVPFGKKKALERYNFTSIRVRSLLPGQKIINRLITQFSVPIPMDIWFGKGVYVFPNYKNWWVPFSESVTFVHDVAFKVFPETINPKNLVYLEKNMARWMQRTTKIITISHSSEEEIAQYYPDFADKVEVVHLGVDPLVYKPIDQQIIGQALEKYRLPSMYFLFVGNIEPRKNIETLLLAYQEYADDTEHANALVLLGGDGWNNDRIKSHILALQTQGYSVVQPSEYVPDEDLPALYSGAAKVINVSLHEGFGLSPLQAELCGTPVIVSDLAVFKETLSAGNTLYVDNQATDSIARAMAQEQARSNEPTTALTWHASVAKLMKVIESLDSK